ncbi:MAG: lysylphosphatidylglycerol synthase transmembrane domain-containing protein, partial [Thermodesulfobacteriota bacterium]|nr:lysylphosphatidylglycerol synthase transmembrane domain-containing protein [Thermodesulfobacteriota bacterium]
MKKGTCIQIAVSVLILIILFKFVDFSLFFNSLGAVNVYPLLAAFTLLPVSLLIRSLRWRLILNKDGLRVTLKDLFLLMNVGIALDVVVPGGYGDILKSYYGYKRLGIKEEMLSSSIIDKCVALLAVLLLGVFSTFLYRLYPYMIGCGIGIVILSVLVFLPGFLQKKWTRKLSFTIRERTFDIERLVNALNLPLRLKVITLMI